MSRKFILPFIISCFLAVTSNAQADMRLNWQVVGNSKPTNVAITFKDKNHFIISAANQIKLLKLHNGLYLLQDFRGFKLAINIAKLKRAKSRFLVQQHRILQKLPRKATKFLPVMVLNGATQTVLGFEGEILLLKDYKQSVTIVSSQNAEHVAIKNAVLPTLRKLLKHMPHIPNKQLLDILKYNEFGLPLRIGNRVVLTQSATINADKNMYSLDGYRLVQQVSELVF